VCVGVSPFSSTNKSSDKYSKISVNEDVNQSIPLDEMISDEATSYPSDLEDSHIGFKFIHIIRIIIRRICEIFTNYFHGHESKGEINDSFSHEQVIYINMYIYLYVYIYIYIYILICTYMFICIVLVNDQYI
jgi:hypothetical protein